MTVHAPSSLLRAEHGMTLIELLLTMVSGLVVLGALVAILVTSIGQETRISGTVQATRVGRIAMANMIDELHSACTGFGATAIQGPTTTPTNPLVSSGSTDLWFISAYGSTTSGAAVPTSVTEHNIHWAATGRKSNTGLALGTLTDYRFASTNSSPEWTFPELKIANATARTIATNVIQTGNEPVFTYYRFKNKTSGVLEAIEPGSVPAAARASEVAKVAINFTQGAEGGDTRGGRLVPFSDAVILRFEPTETGAEAENGPCT